ncbi:MAG: PEP/pyruvate-binding domain-containing protein [Candidatus Saccharimonadales bacterium]
MQTVSPLDKAEDVKSFGGKAANLAKMLQNGLPVPNGLAVRLDAFDKEGNLTDAAKAAINKQLDKSKLYAVRSSALAEDAEGASWAGQFESYLDTKQEDVISKVVECHNSAKARARAYASNLSDDTGFNIAVVVQEMVHPQYAGVLFTKDPITGEDRLVTEYVEGLGEELVSGRADPKQITWLPGDKVEAPFDVVQLTELAQKVEKQFGSPQDIEWAWAENNMWLFQTRPITATQTQGNGYYLGEPEDLFYWGPSRAKPMYMSDFMAAAEKLFVDMTKDPSMPDAPKTLALFWDDKMVWLNNAKDFGTFVEKTFEAYMKRDKLDEDIADWEEVSVKLQQLHGSDFSNTLIEAWGHTVFAEFSLYGAEASLAKQLKRFDEATRQEIWGAFTVPDNSTFLARIDEELISSKDPEAIASKYPWIQDGYDGVASSSPIDYFKARLKVVLDDTEQVNEFKKDRDELTSTLGLSKDEVKSLTLARKLAEFMDDRKAWMMKTRKFIKESVNDIEYGWIFDNGKASEIGKDETKELWQRYVNFRTSINAVKGIVASNGNRHFVNGEVVVVSGPTDMVGDGKIVVVPSTSPSYVPLMRKAKALITDHGGMMSHAAIVAREFNLPCIVGTKNATKILKNGDKVVLDLVKGEVNR